MSSDGNGDAASGATIARSELVDRLELTFDRADGTMRIGGKVVNNEVGRMICLRAAETFETLLRIEAARGAQQAAAEDARVAALLDRARGRSS